MHDRSAYRDTISAQTHALLHALRAGQRGGGQCTSFVGVRCSPLFASPSPTTLDLSFVPLSPLSVVPSLHSRPRPWMDPYNTVLPQYHRPLPTAAASRRNPDSYALPPARRELPSSSSYQQHHQPQPSSYAQRPLPPPAPYHDSSYSTGSRDPYLSYYAASDTSRRRSRSPYRATHIAPPSFDTEPSSYARDSARRYLPAEEPYASSSRTLRHPTAAQAPSDNPYQSYDRHHDHPSSRPAIAAPPTYQSYDSYAPHPTASSSSYRYPDYAANMPRAAAASTTSATTVASSSRFILPPPSLSNFESHSRLTSKHLTNASLPLLQDSA